MCLFRPLQRWTFSLKDHQNPSYDIPGTTWYVSFSIFWFSLLIAFLKSATQVSLLILKYIIHVPTSGCVHSLSHPPGKVQKSSWLSCSPLQSIKNHFLYEVYLTHNQNSPHNISSFSPCYSIFSITYEIMYLFYFLYSNRLGDMCTHFYLFCSLSLDCLQYVHIR